MYKVVYEFPNMDMVTCVLLQRPSAANKSPYVADIILDEEDRIAIAHVPSLNLGGKCVNGTKCLMKYARKTTGKKERVGPDEVSPKYGTPKCEFSSCLVKYKNTWIASHPKIGEDIASNFLSVGSIYFPVHESEIVECSREVSGVAGTNMRTDFLLKHKDGTYSIVEVKMVVDSDSDKNIVTDGEEGTNCAIFPWGKKNQKWNGEKVVSARAIKHVSELTEIATKEKKDEKYPNIRACVLFVIVRDDCQFFRPHKEACSVFADTLKNASEKGVKIIAQKVGWEYSKEEEMKGYDKGLIEVIF